MTKISAIDNRRKTIVDDIVSFGKYDTINVDQIVNQYGSGLTIYIDVDYYYGDSETTVKVQRVREENDEEYEARIQRIKDGAAKRFSAKGSGRAS